MSFRTITETLVDLLTEEVLALAEGTGCDTSQVHVEGAYPYEHFATIPIFVHMISQQNLGISITSGPGVTPAVGEIDGEGEWLVSMYVKVPGAEATAARWLEILGWNLLIVLRNHLTSKADVWLSQLPTGATTVTMGEGDTWHLGTQWSLRVKWTMAF